MLMNAIHNSQSGNLRDKTLDHDSTQYAALIGIDWGDKEHAFHLKSNDGTFDTPVRPFFNGSQNWKNGLILVPLLSRSRLNPLPCWLLFDSSLGLLSFRFIPSRANDFELPLPLRELKMISRMQKSYSTF